jgi:hypothetical protein
MRIVLIVSCSIAAASSLGCTIVFPAPTAAPVATLTAQAPVATAAMSRAEGAKASRHLYRLDFAIAGPGAGATTTNNGTYTMNLEEGRHGELVSGDNVPLAPGGHARTDVGLKIKASYAMSGEDLLVETDTEMSSVDEPTGVHKMVTRGYALVSPGKPALLASVDDSQGKKRYQITVAATKLR